MSSGMRSLMIIALTMIMLGSAHSVSLARQTSSSRVGTLTPQDPRTREQLLDNISREQEELRARAERTEKETTELKARLDASTNMVLLVAAVLAIGTVSSLIGFIRTDVRATEAHNFS